jgi:hypothetical protein
MLKRTILICILGAGLVSMRADRASAHLAGYQVVNGYLKHVGSFDCGIQIKQIPNLQQHPAEFRCTATITEAELLCLNPANQDVNPGRAGTRVVFVAEAPITEETITDKKRGRAEVTARIEDDAEGSPLMNPNNCVNPNWHPIDVLSTKVDVTLETAECTGTDPANPCASSVVAYRETLSCALPPGYSVSNQPPPGTPYECVLISQEHVN